jgi:Fe-S-cluster-containing dehydrogenase component
VHGRHTKDLSGMHATESCQHCDHPLCGKVSQSKRQRDLRTV